ncbi:MAG: hypothetical protein SFW66_04885 [Gammaproteobacteria bacterium]|nr:hypothetical protein [Gammaproteobacteria bacterium]
MNFKEILKALIYAAQNVTQIIPAQTTNIFHYGTLADGRNVCNYFGANICNNFYITDANNQTLGDGFYTIDGNFTWTPSQLNNSFIGTLLDTLHKRGESFDSSHTTLCQKWDWGNSGELWFENLWQVSFSGISISACQDFLSSLHEKLPLKNSAVSVANNIINATTSALSTATRFVETLYSVSSDDIFSFHFGSMIDGFDICKYVNFHMFGEYCQSFYITNFNNTPVSQGFFDIGLFLPWPKTLEKIQSAYLNSLVHTLNTTNTTFSSAFQNTICTTVFYARNTEMFFMWPSQIRFTGVPEWVCEKAQTALAQVTIPPHEFPPQPEEKTDHTPLIIFLAASAGGLALFGLYKCIQQYMQNRAARQPLLPANNPHQFNYGNDPRPTEIEEEKLEHSRPLTTFNA